MMTTTSSKKPGDDIKIKDKVYTLGEKIGSGSEGNIFKIVELDKYVVKILRSSKDPDKDNRKRLNLKRLINRDINEEKTKLILPKAMLDYPDLGYIMTFYDNATSLADFLNQDLSLDFIENYLKGPLGFKKRIRTAAILFNSLQEIHLSGHTFCDISPNNILVRDKKWGIAFIDTDNLVVGNFEKPEILGTPRYIAPELVNQLSSATQESDIFSMAEIIFELLTFYHPYVGDAILNSTPEEEQEAYKGKRDYVLKENTTNFMKNDILANTFLSEKLKKLFYKTFVDGLDDKHERPTANEFANELKNIYNNLVQCSNCGIDYPMFNGTKCPNSECNHMNLVYQLQYKMKTIEKEKEKSDTIISTKVINFMDENNIGDASKSLKTNLYFHDFILDKNKQPFAAVSIIPEQNQCSFSVNEKIFSEYELQDIETKKRTTYHTSVSFDFTKKDLIILRESLSLNYLERNLIYYVKIKKYE